MSLRIFPECFYYNWHRISHSASSVFLLFFFFRLSNFSNMTVLWNFPFFIATSPDLCRLCITPAKSLLDTGPKFCLGQLSKCRKIPFSFSQCVRSRFGKAGLYHMSSEQMVSMWEDSFHNGLSDIFSKKEEVSSLNIWKNRLLYMAGSKILKSHTQGIQP